MVIRPASTVDNPSLSDAAVSIASLLIAGYCHELKRRGQNVREKINEVLADGFII